MPARGLEAFVVDIRGEPGEVARAYKAVTAAFSAAKREHVTLAECQPDYTVGGNSAKMTMQLQPGGSTRVATEVISQVEHVLAFGKPENGSGRKFGEFPAGGTPKGTRDHSVTFMRHSTNNNTQLAVRLG